MASALSLLKEGWDLTGLSPTILIVLPALAAAGFSAELSGEVVDLSPIMRIIESAPAFPEEKVAVTARTGSKIFRMERENRVISMGLSRFFKTVTKFHINGVKGSTRFGSYCELRRHAGHKAEFS